jgi:hypothetical protein
MPAPTSFDQPIILVVCADPVPHEDIIDFERESTVFQADANRPALADLLEV